MNPLLRRKFLSGSMALAAAAAIRPAFAQAPAPLKVRRNINDLEENDPIVVAYKKAVVAMRGKLGTDPTSWAAQARIHLNFCPHGNWFFLPWHRTYLAWFEDICRAASGDDSFVLPYWDWTKDPQVPPLFWGTGNPLNHERDITPAGVIPAEYVGPQVINDDVLATTDFEIFASGKSTTQRGNGGTGRLEGTPHNNVHVEIGGDMVTFLSPLDPIFWLHHANVDRLWTVWNGMGNANASDTRWLDFVFTNNFVNRSGQQQSPKVRDLLTTAALGYRYDTQPEDPAPPAPPQGLLVVADDAAVGAVNAKAAAPKTPFELAMQPNAALHASITKMTDALVTSKKRPRQAVRLRLQEIEIPKDKRVKVRVFINCAYLSEDTPLNSPSYVGSFNFFGLDHAHGAADAHGHEEAPAQPEFIFDITKTLAKLKRSKAWKQGDEIKVQLLALPGTGAGMPLQVKRFTIEAVTPAA